jgi:hypothetical protein
MMPSHTGFTRPHRLQWLLIASVLAAMPLHAEVPALQLPVSGLKVAVDLPADAGTWSATEQSDASGRVDLLTRTLAGKPQLSIVIAVAPAGSNCTAGYQRLAQRAGLTLLERPAYLGARWSKQATDEVDFATNTTTDVACADVGTRSVVAVVSYAGDVADLGGSNGATGTLLDALVAAAEAAGDGAVAFASPGTPLQSAISSLSARARLMADPASATATMAARTGMITVPAGVSVVVELGEEVNSKKAKTGQSVKAVVMQDVVYDDAVVIRKGTAVVGRVADASSGSLGGKGGTLKIEMNSTTAVDGTQVPLSSVAETEGKKTKKLSVKGYFTGWGLLSHGDATKIPKGTPLDAKTTAEVRVKVGDSK